MTRMDTFSETTADALLAHEGLVRAIAADLPRDEHAVADVVQDTWLRALRSVRSHTWDHGEDAERVAAPVWRGLTLAASLRWRLQVWGAGRPLRVVELSR